MSFTILGSVKNSFQVKYWIKGFTVGCGSVDLYDLSEYSQLGLHRLLVEKVDQVFFEENRRVIETQNFLYRLCLLDSRPRLWYLAWRSGGNRRFDEFQVLARRIGVRSPTTVSKYLKLYLELGLVEKHHQGFYRIVGPRWLEE